MKQGIFIPGHRLLPFLLADRKEEDLNFVDAEGNEIQKLKQTFFIQDVAAFYQYCGNFPEEIKINEKVPGKSCMTVTVWDMGNYYKKFGTKTGDALLVDLVDYENYEYKTNDDWLGSRSMADRDHAFWRQNKTRNSGGRNR